MIDPPRREICGGRVGERGKQHRDRRDPVPAHVARRPRHHEQHAREQQGGPCHHRDPLGGGDAGQWRNEQDDRRRPQIGKARPVHRHTVEPQPVLRQIGEALSAQPVADLDEAHQVVGIGQPHRRQRGRVAQRPCRGQDGRQQYRQQRVPSPSRTQRGHRTTHKAGMVKRELESVRKRAQKHVLRCRPVPGEQRSALFRSCRGHDRPVTPPPGRPSRILCGRSGGGVGRHRFKTRTSASFHTRAWISGPADRAGAGAARSA
ncbi:hypothetical protein SAMN05216557_10574 [Sphingomonas carotinifaciens]|uniref:Uncharacterized protein n=1 Tax=Sphingomonas carotinifaciens TaxID=1166323 RepID=A0A1G7N8P2_9SPHN|nr:hypothetical protein [Sphingomonas carotinifaciens]SDF70332.1 hypothetical protein SAMN05216557_10574 [Sphingomonas carotinifaciens]